MEEEALGLLGKIDEGLAIRVENEIHDDGTLDVELKMVVTEAMVRSLTQEGMEGGELNAYGFEIDRILGELRNAE